MGAAFPIVSGGGGSSGGSDGCLLLLLLLLLFLRQTRRVACVTGLLVGEVFRSVGGSHGHGEGRRGRGYRSRVL